MHLRKKKAPPFEARQRGGWWWAHCTACGVALFNSAGMNARDALATARGRACESKECAKAPSSKRAHLQLVGRAAPKGPSTPPAAAPKAAANISPRACLVREYVKCGKCGNGCQHGPYWYAYTVVYKNGRATRKKQYIGRTLPPALFERKRGELRQRAAWDKDARAALADLGDPYEDPYDDG